MIRSCSLTLTLSILSAAACSRPTGDGASPGVGRPPGDAVAVARLRSEPFSFAYSSGLEDSARMVVRDSAAWNSVWKRIHGTAGEVPGLPPIDFASEIIVVAAMGHRSSGGYSIFVDSARQRVGGLEVLVRQVSPGRDCGVTAALTQPVDVARIASRLEPVTFRERREVQPCS